jgi:hypothetical protein
MADRGARATLEKIAAMYVSMADRAAAREVQSGQPAR